MHFPVNQAVSHSVYPPCFWYRTTTARQSLVIHSLLLLNDPCMHKNPTGVVQKMCMNLLPDNAAVGGQISCGLACKFARTKRKEATLMCKKRWRWFCSLSHEWKKYKCVLYYAYAYKCISVRKSSFIHNWINYQKEPLCSKIHFRKLISLRVKGNKICKCIVFISVHSVYSFFLP